MPAVTPSVEGQIEMFKDMTPPENSWTFENLVRYKNDAEKDRQSIRYGKYIERNSSGNGRYAYNYFAYKPQPDHGDYYFAIIIEVDPAKDFNITGTYLFTEKDSVKSWWSHTLWFYESEYIKEIPEEFLYPFCPPPPFTK